MVTLDPIGIPKFFKSDFEYFCIHNNVLFHEYPENNIYSSYDTVYGYEKEGRIIYYSVSGNIDAITKMNQNRDEMVRVMSEYKAYNKSIQQYVFYYKHEKYVKILIFAFIVMMTIILKG